MVNNSKNLGVEGERLAREYLVRSGHVILETNWRFKRYEVDIIAKREQTIVFVEVKARKSDIFGDPEIFVTKQKQRFLIAAAHHYITEKNIELESRFDIISVLQINNTPTVKHLQGAFYPTNK